MGTRRWLALQLAMLALPFWVSSPAASGTPPSPERAYGMASLVFSGVVLSAAPVDSSTPAIAEYINGVETEHLLVTLLVTAVWKGAIGDTIHVQTTHGPFEVGKHYLVYTTGHPAGFPHRHARYGPAPITVMSGRGRPLEYALLDRYRLPAPVSFRPGPPVAKITLEDLFMALDSPDQRMRLEAFLALVSITEARPIVIPRLRSIVRGKAPGDRRFAIKALGTMRSAASAAEPELAWAMSNGNGMERAAALYALSVVGSADSMPRYLTRAFADTANELLAEACYLSHRENAPWPQADFGKEYIRLARHPVPKVRANAVQALRYERAAGMAMLGLIDHLRKYDPDWWVRSCARDTWRKLTGRGAWEGLPKGSPGARDRTRR